MSRYNKAKRALFSVLLIAIFVPLSQLDARYQSSDRLDSMVDFAYPISVIQSVRQNLIQALYFSQHNNLDAVMSPLQDALSSLSIRQSVQDEDRENIQQLLDQINAIIASLEGNDRSVLIVDVCQQIQDRL